MSLAAESRPAAPALVVVTAAGEVVFGVRAGLRVEGLLGDLSPADWDVLALGGLLVGAQRAAKLSHSPTRGALDLLPIAEAGLGVGDFGRVWACLRAACVAEHRDARAGLREPPGAGCP